jgi:hypothetical protein
MPGRRGAGWAERLFAGGCTVVFAILMASLAHAMYLYLK